MQIYFKAIIVNGHNILHLSSSFEQMYYKSSKHSFLMQLLFKKDIQKLKFEETCF